MHGLVSDCRSQGGDSWKVPGSDHTGLSARDSVYFEQDCERQRAQEDFWALGEVPDNDDYVDNVELDWPAAEGPVPARLTPQERRGHLRKLHASLQYHIAIPTCYGLRHSNAAAKASALMFTNALESSTRTQFLQMTRSYKAMCTDMGVELSLSSFTGDPCECLPEWHRWHSSQPVFQNDDGMKELVGDDGVIDGDDPSSEHLLGLCVAIPGICHTINNLLHNVDAQLLHWRVYWPQLTNVAAILGRDQARRRLYATLVSPLGLGPEAAWLKTVPTLHEPRWSMVVQFLLAAMPLMETLRTCWNKAIYIGDSVKGQHASAGIVFDIDAFTTTLASNKFFCAPTCCSNYTCWEKTWHRCEGCVPRSSSQTKEHAFAKAVASSGLHGCRR